MVANTSNPNSSAFSLDMTKHAAAPSDIWLALPAVTIPFSSNTGFNFPKFSKVESVLIPSSVFRMPSSCSTGMW